MDFFDSFPAMERQDLRDLKKGMNSAFATFPVPMAMRLKAFSNLFCNF